MLKPRASTTLTKLSVRNFKRFADCEIPLSSPVVFIGPNNSGKTTALQALALWQIGLRRWQEKRTEKGSGRKGVTIGRRDLLTVPVPATNLLWRNLHVRNVQRVNGKQETKNIRIDVLVEGVTGAKAWKCGLEFDFANDESFFCRPLRLDEAGARMPIPEEAYAVEVAFLPPMSGLSATETFLQAGAINVRLGEGRTAEVLRNLCLQLLEERELWDRTAAQIDDLFGVKLYAPEYVAERGEIRMAYQDKAGNRLDLSSAGRGLQQTLLLTAYLELHPGSVLMLDEPDAHLEILRQRDIFRLLTGRARANGSQLIVASHSESVLNEAAGTYPDSVVAFLGQPHRVAANKTAAVRKALDAVRYDQYYLAEQNGWLLYVEGATDLSVLQAFAARLGHPAADRLRSPFLYAVGNQPNLAREHFNALVEAKPDLVAFLIVDSDAPELQNREGLRERRWTRREIENYLCQPETLVAFAEDLGRTSAPGPLFENYSDAMREAITDRIPPAALRSRDDPWWNNVKASDELLDLIFLDFYRRLGLPLDFRKADYHRLVPFIPPDRISPEVVSVLDDIQEVASIAKPLF